MCQCLFSEDKSSSIVGSIPIELNTYEYFAGLISQPRRKTSEKRVGHLWQN